MFCTSRFHYQNTTYIIHSKLYFIVLLKHYNAEHADLSDATYGVYQCDLCDKRFPTKTMFNQHRYVNKTFYNLFIIIFHLCSIILVLKSYRIINFLFFLTESTNIYRYSSILAQSVLSVYRQMKG